MDLTVYRFATTQRNTLRPVRFDVIETTGTHKGDPIRERWLKNQPSETMIASVINVAGRDAGGRYLQRSCLVAGVTDPWDAFQGALQLFGAEACAYACVESWGDVTEYEARS